MSTSYRNAQLQVGFDPNWGTQAGFGIPRDLADLTSRLNVTTRRHISRDQKVDDILDCTGRYKIGETLVSRIGRLSLEGEATSRTLGGLLAAAFGVAASPSSIAESDEVQTVTITGSPTGGTFRLQFNYETTAPIAYNAAAATVQSALQALSTVGAGNLLVTGSAGGPYTVTGGGAFAGVNLPLLVKSNISLTGGTSPNVSISQGTEGGPDRNSHPITELSTGYQKALFSFVVGFLGEDPVLFYDAVLDQLVITWRVGERPRWRADFIGRGDYLKVTGFTFDDCVNEGVLAGTDGHFKIAGTNRLNLVRQLELTYQNGILADTDPFTLVSKDPTRLETADRVIAQLTAIMEGYIGDTVLWPAANANGGLGTSLEARWRIGAATDGVEIVIPEAVMKAAADPQDFDGEANRAVLNLAFDPRNTDYAAGKPINAIAINGQSVAYLIEAS